MRAKITIVSDVYLHTPHALSSIMSYDLYPWIYRFLRRTRYLRPIGVSCLLSDGEAQSGAQNETQI